MKKIYQHLLKLKNKKYFFYFMSSIIIIFLIIINNSFFQTKVVKNILYKINKNYNTNISIANISINFIIGNIKIKNIQVLDKNNNILIFIPLIEGDINIFNFFLRKINIKNVRIHNPKINIITYKNDYLNNLIYFVKSFKKNKYTNNKIGNFSIINFYVKNAYINIINNNKYINLIFKGKYNFFCEKIIFYNNYFESKISNIILKGIYNNKSINVLFYNKRFIATNKKMNISNNKLIINNSKIFNNLSFYYKKYEDLLNFYKKVFLCCIIQKGSYISSDDINLFFNKKLLTNCLFHIKCKIYGIFNKKIDILNFDIKNGKNIIKSKHIVYLYQKKYFCFFFKKNTIIETSFFDIKKIFSIYITKKIPLFINNYGFLKYYGSIIVSSRYINLNGYFLSNRIGFFSGTLLIFNFKKLKNIEYKGHIYANIYNLYPFLKNKNYKQINAQFIFYGKGYELENNNIKLKGIIKNIFIYDRKIHNINIDGDIINNFFYGKIYVDDNNLNIKFNGKLKIFSYKYFLYGTIQLNFLKLNFLNKKFNNKSIFFPKLYLKYKYLTQNKKKLNILMPNMINISLFGNFKWINLYILLIKNINKLLNNEKYNSVELNQFLYFKIKITDKFVNIFNEKKYYSYNCEIIGKLSDKNLIIYGKSKIIKNELFVIKNFNFSLNTNKKYNTIINIDSFSYKRINIKNINIYTLINNNNILLIKFFFLLKLYNINQEVNLNFFKKNDYLNGTKSIIIGLSRSLIKINNNNWWINQMNDTNYSIFKIYLKNKKLIINNLFFYLKNKKINISSNIINNNYNTIQGIFNNIKYKNFFNDKNIFLNFKISKCIFSIEKYNSLFIFEIKLKINKIYINNVYIEKININIIYNKKNRNYKIFLGIENKKKYILYGLGYVKNLLKLKEYFNLKIKFFCFPVIFFKNFIKNSFSDIRGRCTGVINLTVDNNKINYKGYLYLINIGIRINNINTDYEFINNPLILFKNKTIILKNLIFRDTKHNTIGFINGIILNEEDKWIISIYIDSKNLLVIDTKQINNKLIYGKIFAKGKIHLLGDINNISINVNNAKISNYSKLFISTDNNETNIDDFSKIVFFNKKYKIKNNFLKKENNYKKLSINIESNINEKCEIQLFFNSKKNTFIKARGVGRICFKTNSLGNIEMTGKYYIKNGYYQLNSKKLQILTINKKFKIKRGGNITWEGIPSNPKLNITTFYHKKVSNIENYIKTSNALKNINSELIINIYGKLSQPKFLFDIDFTDINNNIKKQIIQKIYNRNEIITQFVSVILLGELFINNKILGKKVIYFSKNIFQYLIKILSNINSDTKNIDVHYNNKNIIKRIKYSFIYNINKFLYIKGILFVPINFSFNGEQKFINNEINIDLYKKFYKNLKINLFFHSEKDMHIISKKIYGGSIFYRISFEEIKDLYNDIFNINYIN